MGGGALIHSFENPRLWLQAISWGPSGRLLLPLAAAGALLAVGMLWRVSALRSWFRSHTGGSRSAADRPVGHEVGGSDGGGSDGEEERFQDFFANAAVPLHIFGPDRIIIDINQAELDLIGYERSEIVGVKTWADLIVPEQCEQFERHWRRLLQTHDVRNLEYTVIRKDGRHVYVLLNASARYDAQGRLLNTRGSVVDITRRVEAEAALRRSEGLYRTLVENIDLGIMLISSEYEVLMTNVTEGKALSKPVSDLIQREIEKCSKEGVPCAGTRAMATCRPAEDETEGVDDDGVRFAVHIQAFPVTGSEGTVAGFIEVVEDVTDRRDAQRALAESEERYRTLAENIPGVLYRCEIEPPWVVDHLSEGMEKLVGRAAADFMAGKVTIGEMIHPDDLPDVAEAVRQAVEARRSFTLEYRFRHVDGSVCWVHENGRAIYDERGEPLWLDGVILDVSDRHRYEEAQRKSEERYRVFFLTSHDAFMTVTPAGKMMSFNPAMKEMFRAADDAEMMSLAPWQMSPPRQPDGRLSSEKAMEMIQTAMREGANLFEWTHRRFDGEDFPATVMISCGELRGKMILHATIRDITVQKKAEEALRESEERYRVLFENSPDALMTCEPPTWMLTSANPAMVEMFRAADEAELASLAPWQRSPPRQPDGRASGEKAMEMIQVALRDGCNLFEWMHKRIDGEEFWAMVQMSPLELQGQTVLLATIRDITARKKAEEALRVSEASYRSIFDLVTDGIVVHDINTWRLLDINQSVVDMLGYTRDELTHMRVDEFSADEPEYGPEALDKLMTRAKGGDPQIFEWRIRSKTGVLIWVEVSMKAAVVASEKRILAVIHDITERKAADEAIRASEARYRSIFDSVSDGIMVFDIDTLAVLDANQGFADMLGYTRDELTHLDVADLSAGGADYGRQVILEDLTRIRKEGPRHRQWRGKRKTGELLWLEIAVNSVTVAGEERVLAVIHDITERKAAAEAIRASEARYRSIFDLSSDGIVVFDVDTLMILDANQGFADMFGYTRDELTHLTVTDMSAGEPDYGRQAIRGDLDQVREEGPLHRQWRGKRKTGELRWMEVTITVMTVAGEDRGLAVGHDITEKKEADAERLRVAEKMQHAQKLESLGVLAGGIAHDFNNLLVAILGNADLALMDMAANAAERSSIEEIKRAAMRASDLTNQMLAYSGKGQFIIEPVNLNDLVGEMGRLLEVSISKKAILRYDLAEGLPTVEIDASQIRQVVMNLITNASDAIGSASGSISLRTSEVDADRSFLADTYLGESLPEGPYVCLEVSDTGCGMNAETLKRLFEPFYSTKFSGRGLGLAAVLGIVRGHRGGLKVRSELGAGSTFEILIPAVPGVAAVAAAAAAPAALPWQARGVVLVVDDEPSVREVAKIMLTRSGLTVLTAKDGVEATEVFRREGDRIDLVLLDMTMPRMGGDEAYQAMRKMRPDVKVVLTSGYGEKAITDRFALEGLAGFIQKPFELEKLMAMIRDILG